MLLVQSVEAVTNLGLKGDIHAVADSTRQILLIEKETLNDLELEPASVRENITVEGIDLMSLKPRQRLAIGSVVLEITSECEPCERMEEIRAGLTSELEGRRGMLARVVEGGTLSVGDTVTLKP